MQVEETPGASSCIDDEVLMMQGGCVFHLQTDVLDIEVQNPTVCITSCCCTLSNVKLARGWVRLGYENKVFGL